MQPAEEIHIQISYKLRDASTWQSLDLKPGAYFETPDEAGLDVYSVPVHDHAIDYLPVDQTRVVSTMVLVRDGRGNSRKITEYFWSASNRLIERTDSGESASWEVILESLAQQDPVVWQIVRIGRRNGVAVPLYHSLVTEHPDGSQSETKLFGGAVDL